MVTITLFLLVGIKDIIKKIKITHNQLNYIFDITIPTAKSKIDETKVEQGKPKPENNR